MKKFMKVVGISALIAAGVVGVVWGAYAIGGYKNPRVIEIPVTIDNSAMEYDAKIENLKDGVVAKLRACESGGFKEDDGIIVFDTNHKASVGTLQWQVESVKFYYKALYGKAVTGKEAIVIALDDKRSGELAKRVMFETKNMAGKDWVNCAVRHNLDNEIVIIKKLEVK